MINVKKIRPQRVGLYENGKFICTVNQYELNDLLIQIKNNKAD